MSHQTEQLYSLLAKDSDVLMNAIITVNPGHVWETVNEAEEALLPAAERLQLFQRAGEVVRVITLAEARRGGGLQRPPGTIMLDVVTPTVMVEMFERVALFEAPPKEKKKKDEKEAKPRYINCPQRVATTYLARKSWRLPVLAGIIFAPAMRDDGTVIGSVGFDEQTGLIFVSRDDWFSVPAEPTQQDAAAALETLMAPFKEVPYCTESDRAVHAAAILTGLQRRLLPACPLFGFSAPAQRTGKSLLAESVAIIATGKPAPATGVSPQREELRKAITSSLREGHAVVNLDNITDVLESPDLARAITQPEYADRMLGVLQMLHLPTNMLWTATGNNLTVRGDMTSRTVVCRIDASVERPEERGFEIADLKTHLAKKRPELVEAALTILRAYHVAKRPKVESVKLWGGFEAWSRGIREPLIWAGAADPCGTRENVIADDPEIEAIQVTLDALFDAFPSEGVTSLIFTTSEAVEKANAVGNNVLQAALLTVAPQFKDSKAVDPRRLAKWFNKIRSRIVGGLRIVPAGHGHGGAALWKIEKMKKS